MYVLAHHVGAPTSATLVGMSAGAGDRVEDLAEVVGQAPTLPGRY
jgi:hypothetical protein